MGRRALVAAAVCIALAGVALLFVTRSPRPAATPPRSTPRADAPSVLLLTLDTTRADALHCYGSPHADASPCLDALAAEGVRFAQARTTVPMSLPSHASIMTGRWPFETGVRDNASFRLGAGAHTLAERFREAGYTTGAVVGSLVLHSVFGLNQGFDTYSDTPATGLVSVTHQDERTATQITDECLRLLDEKGGSGKRLTPPFFLWAHFFDPHFPYEPPEPFLTRFLARAAPGGKGRARYAGEVAYMDQEVGRLIKEVRARIGGRPLVVLAIGDHGEALGDHGEDSHGMMLYDATLRVPCILAGSDVPRGVVVTEPVSSIDVAPTLLELCGLDHADVTGLSCVALARGAAPGEGEARPLYYEILSPYFSYGWSPLFAVGIGARLFIDGPRPELFDVATDPDQKQNLVAEQPEVVRRARLQFERWRTAAAAPVDRPDLSREERERIARLGYVGAFAATNLAIPVPGQIDAKLRDPRDGVEITHKMFQAEQLMAQGKFKPANALASELLKIDGENPMVQQLAGTTLIEVGEPAQALPLLEKSVARRGDTVARFTLAQALKQLGRRDEALQVLERLVAEHGEVPRARLLYGELLVDAGRNADAVPHLEYFLAHVAQDGDLKQKAEQLLARARSK